MNTNSTATTKFDGALHSSSMALALGCALLAPATTIQAAKPKPPPTPSGPAYRIIPVEAFVMPTAINSSGTLVGQWIHDYDPSAGGPYLSAFSLAPALINGSVQYLSANVLWLRGPAGTGDWGVSQRIADNGWGAGAYLAANGYYQAAIWVDGTPIELGYVAEEDTHAYGINNAGMVAVGPYLSGFSCAPCYVVVPKDTNADGILDTWFEDLDGDGFNDLLKLLTPQLGFNVQTGLYADTFAPEGGINDAGQVVLNRWGGPGYRLTPDWTDADGDGNPWYADLNEDLNGDGFNDLLVPLVGLGSASSYAVGINSAGQVVGSSNNRAVRWDFANGVQTIIDLGLVSGAVSMWAAAINDSGQIVGTSAKRRGAGPAWLFHKGTVYDLLTLAVNPEGWSSLDKVQGINSEGWIVGVGSRSTGGSQAFVAVPIAQP